MTTQGCYDISSEHGTIAVVLDPRHKLQFYDDEKRANEENYQERTRISNYIKEIFDIHYATYVVDVPVESETVSRVFIGPVGPIGKRGEW